MILLDYLINHYNLNIHYLKKKIILFDEKINGYLEDKTAFEDAITGYEKSGFYTPDYDDQIDEYYYLTYWDTNEYFRFLEKLKRVIYLMIDLIKTNSYLFNDDILNKLKNVVKDEKKIYEYLKPKILNYYSWCNHI